MSISTIIVITVVGVYFIIFSIRRDSKYGINLKRVRCPKCKLKQPIIREPKNERQLLYGGYTCDNCGTEMDKYGSKIID